MRRILLAPALAAAVLTASCGTVEEPATDPSPTAEQSATEEASGAEEEATTTEEEPAEEPEETTEEPEETTGDEPEETAEDEAEETTEEPEETTGEAAPPAQECSGSGYTAGELNAGDSPAPVVQLATTLLDAAVDCDQESLIAAADADQPSLSFGEVPAEEALALPDVEGRYLALAVLLTATSPSQEVYEGDGAVTVWPAAYSADATDADWQEIVDAGLYSADEVEQMRGAEGYSGWRVGIAEDGTWLFFVAGD